MKEQIPIESVGLDKLPQENAIQYEEICQIIGALYIDNYYSVKKIKEQATNLVKILKNRIVELADENKRIKGCN